MATAAAIVTEEMLKKNVDLRVLKKKLYLIIPNTLIKIYTLVLKYVRYYSEIIHNVKCALLRITLL